MPGQGGLLALHHRQNLGDHLSRITLIGFDGSSGLVIFPGFGIVLGDIQAVGVGNITIVVLLGTLQPFSDGLNFLDPVFRIDLIRLHLQCLSVGLYGFAINKVTKKLIAQGYRLIVSIIQLFLFSQKIGNLTHTVLRIFFSGLYSCCLLIIKQSRRKFLFCIEFISQRDAADVLLLLCLLIDKDFNDLVYLFPGILFRRQNPAGIFILRLGLFVFSCLKIFISAGQRNIIQDVLRFLRPKKFHGLLQLFTGHFVIRVLGDRKLIGSLCVKIILVVKIYITGGHRFAALIKLLLPCADLSFKFGDPIFDRLISRLDFLSLLKLL